MIGEPLEMTGITQNVKELINQSQEMNFNTSHADYDFEGGSDLESSVPKTKLSNRKIKDLEVHQNGQKSRVIRRDVINKTIFRIIRRYFHMLLEKAVPDYKSQKKHNLMKMLISFSEFLFPEAENSSKMAEVMSALMFRREVLISNKEVSQNQHLQVFLDIQSKYSHKLLKPALENKYFRKMFERFIDQGMEFYEFDENVLNNSKVYHQELEKIVKIYSSISSN